MTPTVEDLKRLPLRAIVAYAARWAERVRPALEFSRPIIDVERHRAVDTAIASAKAFAEGADDPQDPRMAMPMAENAKTMAVEAVNAVNPQVNSQAGYAARTAALAAETLAQAVSAFAPPSLPQADDIVDVNDPLALTIEGAAMMAHSAAYCARFLLREGGFDAEAADDFATLVKQCPRQDDRIGAPVDLTALGSLWRGKSPQWSSSE